MNPAAPVTRIMKGGGFNHGSMGVATAAFPLHHAQRDMRLRSTLSLALLLVAASANAAIYIAPKDVELIDAADLIVIGTITTMNGEFLVGGDINTVIEID